MRGVVRAEDGLAFGLAIGLPDVLDVEDGEHDAFGIAQGDLGLPGLSFSAKASVTSSVIGIGQSVPSARRMLLQTLS